ncbi:uncharacterized protein LOC116248746 [Nymphaea colorata]|nr:uncharacterized protein LOC116248746 [Nymphaea colorata]
MEPQGSSGIVGSSRRGKKRETVEVKVDVVPEAEGLVAPFVGYFPSGFDIGSSSEGNDGVRVRAFRNTDKFKKGRLQLVINDDNAGVDFVGTNYSGEGALFQPCTYALGVLDKNNGSLKILPIAGNKIFRLEPRVRGLQYVHTGAVDVEEEKLTDENRLDKLRALTSSFGTKRSKSQVTRRESRRLKEENLDLKEAAENLIKDANVQGNVKTRQEVLHDTNTSIERNIPPYDLTAVSVENVYPLDKIILETEWEHLYDILELLEAEDGGSASEILGRNGYPIFVCNRVHKVMQIMDLEKREKLAGILSYITCLLKFMSIPSHSIDKLVTANTEKYKESSTIPGIILIKFMKMFADAQKSMLSREKSQLLISYILVLTLFVDEFDSDPSDIAKDLKMTPASLKPYYMELGCGFRKSCVILSLPLKFPTLRLPSQGGRRNRR